MEVRKTRAEIKEQKFENAKGDRIFQRAFLERGKQANAPKGAVEVVKGGHYVHLTPYEDLLVQFKYGLALDTALKVLPFPCDY